MARLLKAQTAQRSKKAASNPGKPSPKEGFRIRHLQACGSVPGSACARAAGSLPRLKEWLGGVKDLLCFQENALQHGFCLSTGTHYTNSVSIQPDI